MDGGKAEGSLLQEAGGEEGRVGMEGQGLRSQECAANAQSGFGRSSEWTTRRFWGLHTEFSDEAAPTGLP